MSTGIMTQCTLPNAGFAAAWEAIKVSDALRERLVAQSILSLTIRREFPFEVAPLHGLILLAGPPGTGKTTLARGLANRVAQMLKGSTVTFAQVDPHALASAALGKSQQQVAKLFQQSIPEVALNGPAIVLLDEVETLAADRRRMSLEANPIDVHRATDAVLSALDDLTRDHKEILLIATTNFPDAVDTALLSRADLIEVMPLPDGEVRHAIIVDTIDALAGKWTKLSKLKADIGSFVEASDGLDGRALRKAVISALGQSAETAKDPSKVTSKHMLAALNHAVKSKEADREGA
jgi:pachytene checkpoint protein 2